LRSLGRALKEHDRTVQELPGHNGVRTTMIYAHVSNRGALGIRSPADGLARRPDKRQAGMAYHAGQKRDNETTD